jgi:hypothetical protein
MHSVYLLSIPKKENKKKLMLKKQLYTILMHWMHELQKKNPF